MTRPMSPAAIARLMDQPDAQEPSPTGPQAALADRRVRGVLLRLREEVAEATCRAFLELRELGVDDGEATRRMSS
jgi:hypothetical protein